ncbi:hypothetical protein BJY04DRAFT_218932 [Aspergillus karnatakaensis]|uniref:uncharacterized protein n=1 Tax=Aspergillus karnatakaensis TaxID=1810916 RepID=UPI003CCE4645
MFTDLPQDLLPEIAKHLDQSDALNFSCAHPDMRPLIMLEIHRSPELYGNTIRSLNRFTINMIKNPEWANKVRCLTVRTGGHKVNQISDDDRNEIRLLRARREKRFTEWEQALYQPDYEDPWLALLLPMLPNLETLDLALHFALPYTRRMLDEDPSSLQRLRRLNISRQGYGLLTPSDVLPFFCIESLREFTGHSIMDDEDDEDEEEEEEEEAPLTSNALTNTGFSDVSSLSLVACYSRTAFAALMNACKGLQSFKCTYRGIYGTVNLSFLLPLLRRQRGTLREISLYQEPRPATAGPNADPHIVVATAGPLPIRFLYLGPLNEFVQLRKLHIMASGIVDWGVNVPAMATINHLKDTLPSTLNSLIIDFETDLRYNTATLIEQLDQMLQLQTCPGLTKIELRGQIKLINRAFRPSASGIEVSIQEVPRPLVIALAKRCEDNEIELSHWIEL